MLTIIIGLVAGIAVLLQVANWALTEARWSVVTNNLRLFLIGQYPADQAWRIWASLLILSVLGGLSAAAFGQADPDAGGHPVGDPGDAGRC